MKIILLVPITYRKKAVTGLKLTEQKYAIETLKMYLPKLIIPDLTEVSVSFYIEVYFMKPF